MGVTLAIFTQPKREEAKGSSWAVTRMELKIDCRGLHRNIVEIWAGDLPLGFQQSTTPVVAAQERKQGL